MQHQNNVSIISNASVKGKFHTLESINMTFQCERYEGNKNNKRLENLIPDDEFSISFQIGKLPRGVHRKRTFSALNFKALYFVIEQ